MGQCHRPYTSGPQPARQLPQHYQLKGNSDGTPGIYRTWIAQVIGHQQDPSTEVTPCHEKVDPTHTQTFMQKKKYVMMGMARWMKDD